MALYEKAVHAPLCTPLDTKATDVEYQPKEDKIAAVTLADETRLPTAFDFDATDQMRFLAKSLNLECTQLGESNRVVQAYFVADGDRQAGDRATQPGLRWLDELSIVRLFKEENEIEGFAIAIPIGNKVGVRVSAPIQNVQGTSDETLMEVAQQAFVQHGILYRDVFPTPISLNSEVNELYHYEQAFGANWLLAGMACYNTLLTAAISIDTSFITLFLPVQFMKNPKKIGGLYQQYIAHALQTTELYRWLASHEFPALPLAVRMKGTEYLWANVALLCPSIPIAARG